MLSIQTLDKDTPEDRIAELVDAIKQSPSQRNFLVELLPEQNPLYRGRGTNQTIRIRGYILAAFQEVGLPEDALPYVLDDLENGRDAYLVAAAAKALRGLQNPSSEVIPFLFKAIKNIRTMDDALTFERYKPDWPVANHTSALKEIFRSFKWLGAHARAAIPDLDRLLQDRTGFSEMVRREIKSALDAIQASEQASTASVFIPLSLLKFSSVDLKKTGDVRNLEFEDQDGVTLTYGDFFNRTPSIVVFFYTRCNNPNKCSLTITKLARLQKLIIENGLEGHLKTAAITYEPDYDLPGRLRAYGNNRGVMFNDNYRFLRSLNGFSELQNYFDLGVNFNGSIVNQHRIELFILDDQGRIAETFARLQWDVQEVLNFTKGLFQLESKT